MTLRQRSAIVIVTAVMLMLIAFSVLIYYLLVNNHRNQFHSILRDKAIQTVKLLDEVKEVDSTLLSIIDAQTLHELRDEKTFVLDSTGEIVYSSADDHRISWDKNLLKRIRQEGTVYFSEGEYETAGIFYSEGSITRFILVAAKDAGGKQCCHLAYHFTYFLFFCRTSIGTSVYFATSYSSICCSTPCFY